MKAIVIAIGDEILIGQVVDTNSTFISKELYSVGIETLKSISIQDDPTQIIYNLDQAFKEVDLIIFTGGLGPTNDDLTKLTLTEYFGDVLVLNTDVLEHIRSLFKKMNRKMVDMNKEQALLPKRSTILHNEFGTAAGMVFEKGNKIAISLPGVPFEMKNLVENHVIPFLQKKYNTLQLVHKTVLTYGLPESELAEIIYDWENSFPDDMKLAYLPSPGRVRLRISLKGEDRAELVSRIDEKVESLKDILGDLIFGYDDEQIEDVVAKLLTTEKLTISTAESFTGGKLASLLTSVPGSSKYFKGSIVSYATEAKIDILNIDESLIKEYTVVSEEVAILMADNARKLFKTDYAIATTGVAGPDRGEDGKDPGTAIIAISSKGKTIVKEFQFGQPREKMQGRAIAMAFDMLRKEIQ
ncbi:MAG: competence/damage-inducible protein A [Flavobacteriales bacterium]|nr:competence/damage-inducible protein A [Flavobacteriales bacterium]